MASPKVYRGATTPGRTSRKAVAVNYVEGRSASVAGRALGKTRRSTTSGTSSQAPGTDHRVVVTPIEKRAAELRIKIDRQRGATTPDHIRAIAEARRA